MYLGVPELNNQPEQNNQNWQFSRILIAACADNDVNTVRRMLVDSKTAINEGTDDGESLLSLASSAGYYELAQVSYQLPSDLVDELTYQRFEHKAVIHNTPKTPIFYHRFY